MITINLRFIIVGVALLSYGVGWLVWTAWEQRQAKHKSAATNIMPYLDVLTAAPIALFLLDNKQITYSNQYGSSLLERLKVTESQLLDALPYRTMGKSVVYKSLGFAAGTVGVWVGNVDTDRRIVLVEEQKLAQKEQERLQFWGSVSHELRTPITSILAHLEVAQAAETPPQILHTSLDIAHQQTRRVSRMIQNILELSRLSTAPLEMRPVDVVLLAEEAVATLILLADSEQISLKLNYPPNTPPVLGNADKLKQVFINLIDNAIKYCEAGDVIHVELVAQESGVLCTVRDTGRGIDAEHLPRLTEQFFRVRRDVSGSGLGLAIVNEIVRQHNSLLKVNSTPRQIDSMTSGTTFSFTVPYGGNNLF